MSKITSKKLVSLEKKKEAAEAAEAVTYDKVTTTEGEVYEALQAYSNAGDDIEVLAALADARKSIGQLTKLLEKFSAKVEKRVAADKAYKDACNAFDAQGQS